MRLAEARQHVEALEEELGLVQYEQLAGLRLDVDTGPLYQKHAALFEGPLVEEALAAARAPGAGNGERFLAEYLARGYLDARLQPLTDEADTRQASLQVELQGEGVPYRMLAVRIANEPHRERRRDLAWVQAATMDRELNPLLRQRVAAMHDLVRELGFPDYVRYCEAIKGVDLTGLREALDPLVRRTDTLYRWHMEGFLGRGASVMLAFAEKHDVAHATRAPWFDDQFPRGTSLDALEKVLAPMGLSVRQPNVLLDVEERPAKSPRAFVIGVRVPEDVRMVVQPKGGLEDYRSTFHEAGHALHFGLTQPGLPMEFKRLGDNSVTEAFAFVLEHLLAEEAWARQRVAPHLLERYLWQQRVLRLFMVRRYVAKLRYELELHAKGPEGGEAAYKKHLERVLVFQHPREHWLTDLDDAFYAANYLRAWALEALLRGQLKERFGAAWWERREAGAWLRGLWAEGQRFTPEELCERVGARFSVEPLQRELLESLKVEPRDYHELPRF